MYFKESVNTTNKAKAPNEIVAVKQLVVLMASGMAYFTFNASI